MVRATRSGLKTEPSDEPTTETPPATLVSQVKETTTPSSVNTLGHSSHTTDMMDVTNDFNHCSQGSDAMQSLGEKSRRLIQTIQKLEALRIDATLPSLPKFVVVGDQSHGKSSIIEAVCDITLPRGQGTCTRCPFRITTTSSKEGTDWKCEVTLLYRYSYNPKTRNRWDDTAEQNPVTFATVNDKSELGRVLRLAQLAILNPGVPPCDILGGRTYPGDGVKFSPNVIGLEISAPGLPELSLFDLPGTINVHPNEDEQHLVGFIERLVKTYLKDEKALVLLAASANQDLECSLAAKFVLACKANNRSRGVLTKPDLITNARIADIRTVLEGGTFKLGGGWFVTKHSSQEEINRGISHAEARRLEAEFFQGEPWSTELAGFADRCGIPSLQEALSLKLTEHILNDLPEMTNRVSNRLKDVKSKLDTFAPESKEPCLTVMSEIDNFEAHLVNQLKGESLQNEFRLRWRNIFKELGRALVEARPNVMLSSVKQRAISLDESDSSDEAEDEDSSPTPAPAKKSKGANGQAIATPSSNDGTSRPRRIPVKQEIVTPRIAVNKVTFTLDGIRQSHEDGRASTLPEANWKVTLDLITKSLAGLDSIVEATLKLIKQLLLETIQKSMNVTLGSRQGTKLYDEAGSVVGDFFGSLMSERWTVIDDQIKSEQHKAVTYQQTHLQEKINATKNALNDKRAETRAKEYMDRFDIKINSTKPEERKKKVADIQTKLPRDEYTTEIEAVAKVLAYYDLATANIPDMIAKLLEFGLLYKLETGLKTKLRRDLNALDANYCLRLLAVDPAREEMRLNLLAEKEKLNEALQELRGLSLT